MEYLRNWTGPITEAAITGLSAGFWAQEIVLGETANGSIAIVKVFQTDKEGPRLIVTGDDTCHSEFGMLEDIFPDLKSGTVILIEYSGAIATALESPQLWPLLDSVDEVIVVQSAESLPWEKLENPRFLTAAKETLLRESLCSMRELGLIDAEIADRVIETTRH